jgi:hypothetical protein
MALHGMRDFDAPSFMTKNEARVYSGIWLTVMVAALIFFGAMAVKIRSKDVVLVNQQLLFELKNTQRGDIVWFKNGDYKMVHRRDNFFLYFKIPTFDVTPQPMAIEDAARDARGVIVHDSFSVAWNNAVYRLTTGYNSTMPEPTFAPSK